MAFLAESGRILITDASANVIFDTDEGLFNGTDFISGSIVIPARSGNTIEQNNDHVLASINANANTVVGSFKLTTSSSIGVSDLGWFCAGGTYVHYWGADAAFSAPSNENWWADRRAAYSFIASGSQLILNERVSVNAGSGITLTINSITFTYKIFAGTFT